MNENCIILTHEDIESITNRVKEEASNISYEIVIPATVDMSQGAILAWEEIRNEIYQYIDGVQDSEDITKILHKMGVTVESLIAVNEDTAIEPFYFGENCPVSLNDFKIGLERAIISDLGSAWVNCIRNIIEDICGEDPLGGNDGLWFPED